MKPSFFNLYKRGRYFRPSYPVSEDNEDKAKTGPERNELERFVAAAIAFCFKYDKGFQRHFWKKVCKMGDDPDLPSHPEIQIEEGIGEKRWADITIRTKRPRSSIHLIECKILARPESHQDPNKPDFFKERGYGRRLRELSEIQGTALRYVILGGAKNITWENVLEKDGILCAHRRWTELADGCPDGKPIIKDLIESLGAMDVPGFHMKKARQYRVTSDVFSAALFWEVRKAVLDTFDLPKNGRNLLKGTCNDDGLSEVGVHVMASANQKHKGSTLNRLKELTGQSSGDLFWFGYRGGKGETPTRYVYLNCNSPARAEAIDKKLASVSDLKRIALKPKAKEDGPGWPVVIIQDKRNSQVKDVDWFTGVIGAIAGIKPR